MLKHMKIGVLVICCFGVVLAFQNCASDFNSEDYISDQGSQMVIPHFIDAPADRVGIQNQDVELSVNATGGSLTFQWEKDGSVISGQSTESYLIAAASPSDAGRYTVTVSNPLGSTTASFNLSIQTNSGTPGTPPQILGQPRNVTARVGTSRSISVSAIGPGLQYQWYYRRNSGAPEAVLGGTNYILRFDPLSFGDGVKYRVQVYNSVGSVFSEEVDVTVLDFDRFDFPKDF